MLEITVHEIRGHCPVYKEGDRLVFKDPEIDLEETDALCTHALSTILHYTTILEHHWIPLQLGLTREGDEEHAYLQCVDPGKPYTHGGTVIFRCQKPGGTVKKLEEPWKSWRNHENLPSNLR